MKNIFKIFLLSFAVVFTSCDDELDINTDPNSPAQITKGLALASSEASLVTILGGELTNLGGFWAQYHTQSPSASQYEVFDQYNLTTSYADRLWTEIYAGCLNDLEFTITTAQEDGDTGTVVIATCLKAYTFQLMVDLFGDIPYTEALQGIENITPAVTPGEDVYTDLIAKLDEAVAAYEANPVNGGVGSQDQIYGGNVARWIEFSNTLKLKMYIRMAYTPMANPTAVNALLAEDNFITVDAAFTNFADTQNKRNPFYEVQIDRLGDVNNVASNTLRDFYESNGDIRIQAAYRPAGEDPLNFPSISQGTGNDFNNTAVAYGRPNIWQETPVFLMSLAESNFLQAEALIRYAGGAGAKEKYDNGVLQSFLTYSKYFEKDDDLTDTEENLIPVFTAGEATAAATALTEAGGAYEYNAAGDTETLVRQVIIQKWASLPYINNIEAYIEATRTKFPEVVPEGTEDYSIGNRIPSAISTLPNVQIPSILFYPDDEVNRNPNITQHTSLTDNVWWDQKTE
ncbi:SusD/RagB family nutrient-binding outer membrane lipoprotein [Flavobacterium beibuense]|uniref:Putative tetratricopeptide repeat-containing domain protein n=1 Tax=Flavobacterium beibuense TaxID=657326 RepID=A0A444WIG7_9FLAO|nr:SusD/RagB family nutrient-binding outer membrane lipoprotein [Flavobacterium beibuense]RYJ45524.1 putative tetratricopeptide repeat-containing domain protein [Flavobacterium beibuense]